MKDIKYIRRHHHELYWYHRSVHVYSVAATQRYFENSVILPTADLQSRAVDYASLFKHQQIRSNVDAKSPRSITP